MGDAGFQHWRDGFRAHARREGISEATLQAVVDALLPRDTILDRDRNQAEFVRPIWTYLDAALSEERVENGCAALARWENLLDRICARYTVAPEIVVAIWGLETAYGSIRGAEPVPNCLATLAFDGRRGAFFEAELIAALRILDAGEIAPNRMLGSWAGAMGHTQFMPTTYLAHAVDFDGDGRRDIWSDDPTDALASTAAYLEKSGWTDAQPWGCPVDLPAGFDLDLTGRNQRKSLAEWDELGLVVPQDVGASTQAALLLPAGWLGPAFLTFQNFEVLRRYNAADAYVFGVGLLADCLRGMDRTRLGWPRHLNLPDRRQMRELQERLTEAGFDTKGSDGLAGPNTSNALRAFQRRQGLRPDGFATLDLLDMLRGL